MYPDTLLHIAGEWRPSSTQATIPVVNPATEEPIGTVAHSGRRDLEEAVRAAKSGFAQWRRTSALERAQVMKRASALLRERQASIAEILTMEQGKPLHEALNEVRAAAETNDWFAEEAQRTYGRVIPSRTGGVHQFTLREPVGPVAAFTPWNFPIIQIACKLPAALAAGCSIIVKAPEETPAAPAEFIRAFVDAGLPSGVVNLVFGVPSEISQFLISHPDIRKVSFTGSTAVGKQLAALAGQHMKRTTMELGGHSPAIVFADADIEVAVSELSAAKHRNAGQVCVSPTRFLVEKSIFAPFVEKFVEKAAAIKVGDGMMQGTMMGPLANRRRLDAMDELVADAAKSGAEIKLGGQRMGNKGYFFSPTVVANPSVRSKMMNEEPFGPLALLMPFDTFEDAIGEANRLSYGLAAYAYTGSAKTAAGLRSAVESGMLSINHMGLSLPETPFGGVKDSGVGLEGGSEGIDAYLSTKFVTEI